MNDSTTISTEYFKELVSKVDLLEKQREKLFRLLLDSAVVTHAEIIACFDPDLSIEVDDEG